MWYVKPSGERVWVDKQDAEKFDQEHGRTRANSSEQSAIINLNAALSLLKQNMPKLEQRLRTVGKLASMRRATSLVQHSMNDVSDSIKFCQVCSMRNQTANSYVKVSAMQEKDCVNIDTETAHAIVTIARGGLYDERGEVQNCTKCMAAMNPREWKKCPLYETIQMIPCDVWEERDYLADPEVCPFMVSHEEAQRRIKDALAND